MDTKLWKSHKQIDFIHTLHDTSCDQEGLPHTNIIHLKSMTTLSLVPRPLQAFNIACWEASGSGMQHGHTVIEPLLATARFAYSFQSSLWILPSTDKEFRKVHTMVAGTCTCTCTCTCKPQNGGHTHTQLSQLQLHVHVHVEQFQLGGRPSLDIHGHVVGSSRICRNDSHRMCRWQTRHIIADRYNVHVSLHVVALITGCICSMYTCTMYM